MDIVFRGLIYESVVIYHDEIAFYSKNKSNHLHHLKYILGRCWKYDISLNMKKRIFGVLEGKLLGNIILKDGILMDLEWIKVIIQVPMPINKNAMKYFFGKINFSQRFGSNFAKIVKPLQKITQKTLFLSGLQLRKKISKY